MKSSSKPAAERGFSNANSNFVKAHHHFSDHDWDGEPKEPEPSELRPGSLSDTGPEPDPPPRGEPQPPKQKVKVKLADGKARAIQSMTATSFWNANGRPMSAAQFLETLFDVLAYVAYAREPLTREARAEAARAAAAGEFTDKQQAFIDFVLAQYVKQGVDELDAEKLSPLLRLRYKALNDAFAELGKPEQVRGVFLGFQRHLYAPPTRARLA